MAALLDSKRWDVLEQDEGAERRLVEELGIAPLVARILVARGVIDADAAREFLSPSLMRDWADPLDIPGMREAADRVEQALVAGERIAVFGDFDVDGMTSTCLLTQALRVLGGTVDPYIPHRFGEGYGLTRTALARVIEGSHPDLIITVDNGISAGAEVAWLVEQGIDVVVTDHHEPADLVPEGVPVTDPKLTSENYSRELAGAGVALKLVFELGRRLGKPDLWWDYTDLAALGTVSDMMLLTGENRSLVAHGIARMRTSRRPGFIALAATSKCALADITADNLPFSLIPRLNAAGRMGTTEVAFDLLISEDMAEAQMLAGMLEQTNTKRRETESELADEALRILADTYHGEQVIVVGGADWHEGVKGIVASRIVSRYHVPAIVFSITDGVARGSGRSVGSVDLFHAVEQCQDLLVRFGGHAGAVGVTCREADIDAFRARLVEVVSALPPEQFEDRGEVAAIASLSELTRETIDALDVLAPFGQGNKRPLIGIRSVFMRNRTRVGYDANHLRFIATDGVSQVPAIMFRTPEMSRAYAFEGMVDLVVDAVNETWQGRTNPKLMVQDICYHDEARGMDERLSRLANRLCATGRLQDLSDVVVDAAAARYLRTLDADELLVALAHALRGGVAPDARERSLIERLEAGEVVLASYLRARELSELFMCLHALSDAGSSLVVVPASEIEAVTATLVRRLAPLGLAVREVTADTDMAELGLSEVWVAVLTPERLETVDARHVAAAGVGFVCVLEATGAALARTLAPLKALLARVQPLACCVASSVQERPQVARSLNVAYPRLEGHMRSLGTLRLHDLRGMRERETLLARLVTLGARTLVYAGTWQEARDLAVWLTQAVPSLAGKVVPYEHRLEADVRTSFEQAFEKGGVTCIVFSGEPPASVVATDVVLFAVPESLAQLTRIAEAVDGTSGTLHLLFGEREVRQTEMRLQMVAPERTELVTLYRTLVAAGRSSRTRGTFSFDKTWLCSRAHAIDATTQISERTVRTGVTVFEELGFLHVRQVGQAIEVEMVEGPRKVELERSATYLEAHTRLDDFRSFARWLLAVDAKTLSEHLSTLMDD